MSIYLVRNIIVKAALLAPVLLMGAPWQAPSKVEFEVASIKPNAPQTGFHFASDAVSGGPGTADPVMFRCSKCSLATLIAKAFRLQPYQFPGRTSLTGNTFDVSAKIPLGASEEEFSAMLQNLLKDRFGLNWHFQEKMLKGYHLVVSKSGPKLKESNGALVPASADQHRFGQAESHNHSEALVFGNTATYRAAYQTGADLARILSDQTGVPVDDQTGLTGKYDIALRWSGTAGGSTGNHSDGAFSGGGHTGHDGAGATPSGPTDPAGDISGPTLFDALQQQLGLRLVPADQSATHLFIVDRVAQRPTEN